MKAERVASPERAATVDILQHLPAERARVVRDLERPRLPEHLWNRIPIACHQVDGAEEVGLARRLLASEMVRIVPETSQQGWSVNAGRALLCKKKVYGR